MLCRLNQNKKVLSVVVYACMKVASIFIFLFFFLCSPYEKPKKAFFMFVYIFHWIILQLSYKVSQSSFKIIILVNHYVTLKEQPTLPFNEKLQQLIWKPGVSACFPCFRCSFDRSRTNPGIVNLKSVELNNVYQSKQYLI